MLTAQPPVTQHAYTRARERLGIDRVTFTGWIGATWRYWIPVNSVYLLHRGVSVSSVNAHLFVNSWTAEQRLCLVLSEDRWVKTVIPYEEKSEGPPVDVHAGDHCYLALQRMLAARDACAFRLCLAAIDADEDVHGKGPKVADAIRAFAANQIDFCDLRDVIKSEHHKQKKMLADAIARNARRAAS